MEHLRHHRWATSMLCPTWTLSLTKSLNSWAISRAEFNVPGQTPTARLVYRFCRSSLYHKSGLNFGLSPGHENQINGRGYPMLQFRRPLCRRCLYLRHSRPLSQRAGFANVQQVKLKKPWVKRFFTSFFLYGAAFNIWCSLVLLRFDEADDIDAEDGKPPKPNKQHTKESPGEMDDADALFIPLTLPSVRPGELYAPSDPEWKEFVKIARDKQRLPALRDELVSIVWKKASESNQIIRVLGGPLTLTGSWLVHRFPYRAPPQFELSGLEFGHEGVLWTSRPMAPEQGSRLVKCLLPFAVTLAMKDAYLVLWRKQVDHVKEFIGFNRPEPIAQPSIPLDQSTLAGHTTTDTKFPPAEAETRMRTEGELGEDISKGGQPIVQHPSAIISTLQRLPRPQFGPGSDLHEASAAFKKRLKEIWKRDPQVPRRGVFYMAGPVGLKGPKGYCRIEVRGEYDPTTRTWTAVSMQVKDLNLNNQRALRV
ncbi:hypothetical protein DTO166G4_5129 [Paecilomyces variotii]|nr:hypothetical protein DTO166G4_5129 [Paecilomyces variotii]KAJ9229569.1 hypothetical protein DTO166G5_7756 [Paecilomyces variotii]